MAKTFLTAAAKHMDDRAKTYDADEGERTIGRVVASFNVMFNKDLTETEGWHFMVLLKMARSAQGGFKADTFEDMTAYSALAGESAARGL